ncbi:MAG: divalent-cation tolerance protein CutA [Candidatus Pacebacteria bacterium CG_4_10_14_0_8_um_filter_42_14]|nr:MAG: divalent-cation tolerance protein CutA [Candidatus Pacebacteria bacterium CG_4_10_14_0_8_um_filter_42_14]
MSKLAFIYITNENLDEAKKIARHLLDKRMIGCANIFPITSMYWWKDKIVDGDEFVLIAKTTQNNVEKIRNEVAKIHPFDTPCIIKIDVDPNEKYLKWIESELR